MVTKGMWLVIQVQGTATQLRGMCSRELPQRSTPLLFLGQGEVKVVTSETFQGEAPELQK